MDHSLLIGIVTLAGMALSPFLLEFAPGLMSSAPAEILAESQAGALAANEEAQVAAQAVNHKVATSNGVNGIVPEVPLDIVSSELGEIESRVISPKFAERVMGYASPGNVLKAESEVAKESLTDVINEEADIANGAAKVIKAETEALKELQAKTAADNAINAEAEFAENRVISDPENEEDLSETDSTLHKIISKSRLLSDTYSFFKYRYETIKSAFKDTSMDTMKKRFKVFGQDILKRVIAAPFIGAIMGTPAPAHSSQDEQLARLVKRKQIRKADSMSYPGYSKYAASYQYAKAKAMTHK